ncbi:uncharacterized protein M421DRAFT_95308 [Didymella exigua CBS 183.55]|uniref:Uncharacterized protein n=1 Tax=Didymella exigua CBS 183.55 TaxID=1150837 RepID=A0A6A5R8K2_9PLEO|nr:uncharacterized protein M421DRAFT_95308 [Didymella exigua CBS 183.55]KAF1924535.1 hypothetical protein M421DRAFT_95308 [Didymella exigua CBS 183.55]
MTTCARVGAWLAFTCSIQPHRRPGRSCTRAPIFPFPSLFLPRPLISFHTRSASRLDFETGSSHAADGCAHVIVSRGSTSMTSMMQSFSMYSRVRMKRGSTPPEQCIGRRLLGHQGTTHAVQSHVPYRTRGEQSDYEPNTISEYEDEPGKELPDNSDHNKETSKSAPDELDYIEDMYGRGRGRIMGQQSSASEPDDDGGDEHLQNAPGNEEEGA